jgi:hypothetical protein
MTDPKDLRNVHQLVELFITDIQDNGGGCDIIPGHHYWVIKGSNKSKKRVPDACTLVDQLGMLGISEEEFNTTYTATKYITNLKKNHPRLRFEIWSGVNIATIIGRDEYMPGAPNNKDQIIKNKNASRNARLLARRSATSSNPINDSSGPSSHSINDPSEHTFLSPSDDIEDSPAAPPPDQNILASKIVPL